MGTYHTYSYIGDCEYYSHSDWQQTKKCTKRQQHCADVRPGSSRIYSCLLASAEQGGSCIQMIKVVEYIGLSHTQGRRLLDACLPAVK